ncbi:MAG: hypothetical protein JNM47_14860, partial [Hyphomonadaceae bacterium]|nr:hypothetical protein [Hyphomonadaceae bacterium]
MPLRPPLRFAAQTDFAARSDFAFVVDAYSFEEVEAPRCGCPACMGAPDDGREQIIFNGGETAFNGKPILSWDEAAATITRGGYTWSPVLGQGVTVSYAFRADAPETMPNGVGGFVRFTAAQI